MCQIRLTSIAILSIESRVAYRFLGQGGQMGLVKEIKGAKPIQLRGSGGMLPREIYWFEVSEIASNAISANFVCIIWSLQGLIVLLGAYL